MRPSRRSAAVLACLGVLVTAAPAAPAHGVDCPAYDSLCQDLNDARDQQSATAQSLADIQSKIKDTQARAAAVQVLIIRLLSQIQAQQAEIDRTQARVEELDRQIRFTLADIARREAHLKVREQLLGQRVRAVDKHGSVNYMELLVTSASFNQLIDRVLIMHDIVRSDRRLLDELRQERDQLNGAKAQLDGQRADQARLLLQQQDQKAQLQATEKQQEDARAYLAQLEAQYESQRQQLQAQKAQLDALVLALQQQYDAAAAAVGGGSGIFGWPIGSRSITQGFGCSTLLGEPIDQSVCPRWPYRAHTGIDVGGSYGTGIFAADAGIVSSVITDGWGGGYGNNIIVTHGNGYATLYAHLSAVSVRKGQPVRRGDRIGSEGSTGFSTGPHLHFEVRRNGGYLNPCAFIGC